MEILGDGLFQLTVDVLRSADETHGRHTVTTLVHRFLGSGDQARIVRQPEIVVRTEVQCLAAVLKGDFGTLGGADIAFVFVKTGLFDGLQLILKILLKFPVHMIIVSVQLYNKNSKFVPELVTL